jgi:RNA polymerase sigma-70 factor (ECF subfamily)
MQATSVLGMAGESFPQEFEALFEEHYVLVCRTAYGVTGRVEDAEDVVQTLFLRLLQREKSPELLKNPKGYLYRAAVNLSLTHRARSHLVC